LNQCDLIGRIFLALGEFFSEKNIAQIIWAQFFSKQSPKIHLNKLRFLPLFALKFQNFDQGKNS
jgi:hypothetical protein